MKIFIAVPTYENISPDTFKSIYGLIRGGHWFVFDFIRGYNCATARNYIAQQTLDENADYVLMVDSDMTLPNDAVINLLDDPKDVCLGYCLQRIESNTLTGLTNIYKADGEFSYTHQYSEDEINALRSSGQNKVVVHGGGMACALIKADVFRRLEYPWYYWVDYKNWETLSEDLYFCEQCNQNGIPVYVDTRVACGHMFRNFRWPA